MTRTANACRRRPPAAHANGVALLGLLALVAVIGATSAASLRLGAAMHRRAAERELLFVGLEFQRALASYAAMAPAGAPRTPRTLDDLLRDRRVPMLQRHLRRVYRDPITGQPTWGLIRGPEGGIVAVHSLSQAAPTMQTGFPPELQHLAGRRSYSEWVFGVREAGR